MLFFVIVFWCANKSQILFCNRSKSGIHSAQITVSSLKQNVFEGTQKACTVSRWYGNKRKMNRFCLWLNTFWRVLRWQAFGSGRRSTFRSLPANYIRIQRYFWCSFFFEFCLLTTFSHVIIGLFIRLGSSHRLASDTWLLFSGHLVNSSCCRSSPYGPQVRSPDIDIDCHRVIKSSNHRIRLRTASNRQIERWLN